MVVPLKWRQKLLASATLIAFVCAFAQGVDHADPQFRKPINCEVLTDGNYVWGCSRFYSVCANGQEHLQYCYTGLVLNPENDQCDLPKDTIPCQTAGDVNLYKSKLPFTCNGRPDGNYEAGVCQPQYFQCIHGNRNTLPCPAGLVFVPKDNVCDWEANCKKVTDEKPTADRLEKIADPNVGNIGNANAANANANLGYRRSSGSAARNLALRRSSSNQGSLYQGQQVTGSDSVGDGQAQIQNYPRQQAPESPQAIDEDTAAVVDDTFIIGDAGESSGEEAPVQPQGPVPAQARYINQGLPPPPPPQPAVPQGYVSGQKSQTTTTQAPNPRQTRYGSSRQVTAPAKRDPPTTPEDVPFDCSGKEDGVYLKTQSACTPEFYKCANERGFQYQCPPGLSYNVDNNQCDYERFVIACGGTPPPTPDPTDLKPRKAIQFDCRNKEDGLYANSTCSPVFFSCVAGHVSQINCAAGTVFDEVTQVCEFPQQCGKTESTTETPKQGISHDAGYLDSFYRRHDTRSQPSQNKRRTSYDQQSQTTSSPSGPSGDAPARKPAPKPIKFSCRRKVDGYYFKKPCVSTFVVCSAGQASLTQCPGNLVFDPSVASCQYADQCGQTQPPTTTTQSPFPASYTPMPKPDFDCSRRPDGYAWKQPCTNVFYMCNGGTTVELKCPATLVFDPNTTACEYPNMCGRPRPQQQRDADPTALVPNNYYPNIPTQATPPQIPDFNCGGQSDGFHAKQPCQPVFYSCVGGQTQQLSCPASLVYDPALSQCVFADQCGKPVTTPDPVTAMPYYGQPQQQPPQSMPPQIPDFNCGGQSDGFHAKQPCQPVFYSCVGGQTTQISCPSGLLYDPGLSACTFADQCGRPVATTTAAAPPTQPSNVNWYYGQQQQPQRPQSQPQQQPPQALPPQIPDFNCGGQSDGFHAKQPCQPVFYSCVGGQTIQMSCPSNLLYDPAVSACVFVDQCGKSTTTTAAPPTQPPRMNRYNGQQQRPQTQPQQQPPQAMPPQMPDFNCGGQSDGFHAKQPCQHVFYSCVGGQAQLLSCPASLVYDPALSQCVFADQCGRPVATTTAAAPPTQPSNVNWYYGQQQQPQRPQSQPQQPQQQSPQSLPPQIPDFDCAGKPNGFQVKQPCQSVFYFCNGGQATQISCPSNLLYDPELSACVYADQCGQPVATTTADPPTQPPRMNRYNGQQQRTQSQPQQPQQQQPPQALPPQVPDFNCGGQPDGFHAKQPCQPVFYSCVGGQAQLLSCPASLVYDPALSQCVFADQCGRPVATTTAAAPPTQPSNVNWYYGQQQQPQRPQSQPQQQPPQALPPQIPDFNCGGQSDGFHAKQPCQPVFYSCVGGHTTQLACPSGLLYDSGMSACVFADQCGRPQTTTTAPPQVPCNLQAPQQQLSQAPPAPLSPVPDFDCSGKQDGFYFKRPCQRVYYSCVGGSATLTACPSSLVFDPAIGACDYESQCGQPTTTTTVMSPTQRPPTSNVYGQQQQQPQRPQLQPQQSQAQSPQTSPPTSPPDFNCGGQPDGFHAKRPCQPVFYSCVGGHVSEMKCPSGLLYDTAQVACVYADVCGKPVATTASSVVSPPGQSQIPQSRPQQQPRDQAQYQAQNQLQGQTPEDQQPEQPQFLNPLNVPAQPQEGSQPAPITSDQTPIQTIDNIQNPGGNPCADLENGVYGRRCSRFYFSCSNGATLDYVCPEGEVFDTSRATCTAQGHVAACLQTVHSEDRKMRRH
ncbi:chitin binding peritrophin-A domain-containing protein [Ditylenchus destructor]|uniref:Chitin binding peritrophin-A domain-containing protein n=1 Tax=Ditylenchus destructor TaxID=166010 RepID=A0AAD4MPF4_9BILA|nr:chitin binding peritrophin-A domain-containing protein [Ditylenchus destructor]